MYMEILILFLHQSKNCPNRIIITVTNNDSLGPSLFILEQTIVFQYNKTIRLTKYVQKGFW